MKDSFGKEISRRGFIAKLGQGFVAANVAGTKRCIMTPVADAAEP